MLELYASRFESRSDFLAETKTAIERLPFAYQRLFKIKPLVEERFFEKREKELELLIKAYDSWLNEYFAPVAIVGEKGAGATTLMNIFINELETSFDFTRAVFNDSLHNENQLIDTSFTKILKLIDDDGRVEVIDRQIDYY